MVGNAVYCELSEDPIRFTGILDRKGNNEGKMLLNYHNSEAALVKLSTFNQSSSVPDKKMLIMISVKIHQCSPELKTSTQTTVLVLRSPCRDKLVSCVF